MQNETNIKASNQIMNKYTRRNILLKSAAIATSGFLPAFDNIEWQNIGKTADQELEILIDKITRDILNDVPEIASAYKVSIKFLGKKYNNRLTDRSIEAQKNRKKMIDSWIKSLEKIKDNKLKTSLISKEVLLSASKYSKAISNFDYGDCNYNQPLPYVISQLNGSYISTPDFLANQHEINYKEDIDNYLERMRQFAKQLQDESLRLKLDADNGVIAPKFIINSCLNLLEEAINQGQDNIILQALDYKMRVADILDNKYIETANIIYEKEIMPQYNAMQKLLYELKERTNDNPGVDKLPNGKDFYKKALAYWTTTNKSTKDIHLEGMQLVKTYYSHMDNILKTLGQYSGSVAQRLKELAKNKKYSFTNDDNGRKAIIDFANQSLEKMQNKLSLLFHYIPQTPIEIKAVPEALEKNAPGGYYQQATSEYGSSGTYFINLYNIGQWPKWTIPTVTYHEAVAGHHFQISTTQESAHLPFLRAQLLWFGAYGEGWGCYAEVLADEVGIYENDPIGRLGYFQSMLFRAARLVIDTGIHTMNWSYEKAVNYLIENTGEELDEAKKEIERYCVWPAQATCYMIGMIRILELRSKAKSILNDKFDIRDFHQVILGEGAMPLDVLEKNVNIWIAQTLKKHN